MGHSSAPQTFRMDWTGSLHPGWGGCPRGGASLSTRDPKIIRQTDDPNFEIRGDVEIIKLKTARATDAARILDKAFNGTKKNQQQQKNRIRVVADPSTNSLLVEASRLDMLSIRDMVDRFIRQPPGQRQGRHQNLEARSVPACQGLRHLLVDQGSLQGASQQPTAPLGKRHRSRHTPSAGGCPMSTPIRMANRGVDLTVSYDETTNSVFVQCTEPMYNEIKHVVDSYDKDAEVPRQWHNIFNGENLNGWFPRALESGVDPKEAWSASDGVLTCRGRPAGFLRTVEPYENYILQLEFQFANAVNPATGTLPHTEIALHSNIPLREALEILSDRYGVTLRSSEPARTANASFLFSLDSNGTCCLKPINAKGTSLTFAIKPMAVGDWVKVEFRCEGDTIQLAINGNDRGKLTGCATSKGHIVLHADGNVVNYRKCRIGLLR